MDTIIHLIYFMQHFIHFLFVIHLILLSFIDIRYEKVPLYQLIANSTLAIIYSIMNYAFLQILEGLGFIILLLLFLIILGKIVLRLIGKDVQTQIIGVADIWLAVNFGIIIATDSVYKTILYSFAIAAIVGNYLKNKRTINTNINNLKNSIPLIPFLTIGYFIYLLKHF